PGPRRGVLQDPRQGAGAVRRRAGTDRAPARLMPYTLVADQDAFEAVIGRAAASGDVALDTEAASFHRYHDRVYLVQLTAAGETSVIDPLPLSSLAPLGELMGNEQVE